LSEEDFYPAIGGLLNPAHSDTGDTMMMSLYFALGVFLPQMVIALNEDFDSVTVKNVIIYPRLLPICPRLGQAAEVLSVEFSFSGQALREPRGR
jgi:hypothetical protein